MSAAQENAVTDANAQFEDWYVQNAFDYAANPIGSRDCGLMRRAWHAALAARQPGAHGPKFTTEDGPCWHHAGKAFIVTVDGDNLQLMVTDGPRIEFIGDARPFRVPAQGIDLHRLVPPEWTSEQIGAQMDDLTPGQAWRQGFNQCRARALLLVEQAMGFPSDQQRDAAPGVGNG